MNQELQNALNLVYSAPQSIGRIKLLEDAIHIADQCNELEQAFSLRCRLIATCTEYGQFMKALVAFSWCMGRVNEGAERFDEIIWEYQALLTRAAAFDVVSLEKLKELHDDYRIKMKDEDRKSVV